MLTLMADGRHQAVGRCLGSERAALGLRGDTQSGQIKASHDGIDAGRRCPFALLWRWNRKGL